MAPERTNEELQPRTDPQIHPSALVTEEHWTFTASVVRWILLTCFGLLKYRYTFQSSHVLSVCFILWHADAFKLIWTIMKAYRISNLYIRQEQGTSPGGVFQVGSGWLFILVNRTFAYRQFNKNHLCGYKNMHEYTEYTSVPFLDTLAGSRPREKVSPKRLSEWS